MATPALTSYVETLPGDQQVSLWVGRLGAGPTVAHDADARHYAASTMKVAVVVAAYRRADAGTLDLDAQVEVHDTFRSAAGGSLFTVAPSEDSDTQTWQRLGARVALRWLANRAIVVSGNLATNLLLDEVGLPAVAEALAVMGTQQTVVTRGIEDAPAREAGMQNLVTASDLARMFDELAVSRAASPASCDEVLATLAAQQINNCIPRGLPPGTRVAHKTGWVEGVLHDAGIVYPGDGPPYILSVCTTSTLSEQQAQELIAAAAAASWADRQLLS